ncbi:hypothetical protein EHEL_040480 [Encephalitozoon hellem ATCC 50504]|uniref:rRNA-processing protein Utp23 n=1 Tax=Encephalitozoon hellem TaxID=27973 RepID=A0A9Q9C5L0_ENCHE|nr:uncharacterized protein EHEL_040480 [Encephalitozoon hellem ATCC 50504]AFM98099.1 hypothetical protein EHEL_040480 [Encephalitozoon hellem ATCC 50504]UTX42942.1 RRNA-processing protein Utp23 [Encephalitozoon hellem]|eukprot:XP_003887080.1 hypothetical protein EHEL_040480 [Encephalitozoon hellem ATCC 50504]
MNRKVYKKNKKVVKLLAKIGYRVPYQVIVECDFVAEMNKSLLGLRHVNDLFRSQPKLFVTKCVYKKLKEIGRDHKKGIARYLEILHCDHKEVREPLSCLRRVMRKSNKNHYILASNCPEITDLIGTERKIPVVTCRRGTLVISADLQGIPMYSGFKTEADEEELNRLEALFSEEAKSREENTGVNSEPLN